METNTRTNITAPVLAYFEDNAEHALDVDTYENEYGSTVTVYRFPAAVPEGYDIVRVKLNPGDEAVTITGASSNGVTWFDLTVGMCAPLAVIRSAFESAVGLDA